MTTTVEGIQRSWGGDVDDGGNRTYFVVHRVISDTGDDGPATVQQTPGLPEAGDEWSFSDDYDPWAFCQESKKITAVGARDGEKVLQWDVESTFTTKPPPRDKQRCQDDKVEDPMLEPAKVSGGFTKKTEEATIDRMGYPILTSSHEMIRGPQNEWDRNTNTVKIEQNVATAMQGYILPTAFVDCVNYAPLWGFRARCIKLNSAPWERVFYGRCSIYYKRNLEFEIDSRGFDRDILDEGTKALCGHFDKVTGNYVLDHIGGEYPQYYNPAHFVRFKDRNGENTRVVLDGRGAPSGVRVVGRSAPVAPYINYTTNVQVSRDAASLANGLLLGIARLDEMLAVVAQGTSFAGLGPARVLVEAALVAAEVYAPLAQRVAAAANGPGAEPVAADALAAAYDTMNAMEIAKNAVIALLNVVASLSQSTVNAMIEASLQAGRCATNSTGASTASLEALTVIRSGGFIESGTGTSVTSQEGQPGHIHVEKYNEVDFLLLGIPINF